MKFTIFVTQDCNLRCTYCYIDKRKEKLSVSTAEKIIDFIFKKSILSNEEINIGFFGGEPLIEFKLIEEITAMIKNHPLYDVDRVKLAVVTNGTFFTEEIANFIRDNNFIFGISCDGPPFIQDRFRVLISGKKTSGIVEKNILKAKQAFSKVMVNAVYHPATFKYLPQTIEYFVSLGVKQIYLNPDFSAVWRKGDLLLLPEVYDEVGNLYIKYYLEGRPHFISLIDSKITVILRNGYEPSEKCRMGKGEFAFTTKGDIYPCERLVGNGNNDRCIGNVFGGLNQSRMQCHIATDGEINIECTTCGIKEFCMNWCGCSNFMSSGLYNRVSSFLCSSEKAAIQTSFKVFQTLEDKLGPTFYEHIGGRPVLNSII